MPGFPCLACFSGWHTKSISCMFLVLNGIIKLMLIEHYACFNKINFIN